MKSEEWKHGPITLQNYDQRMLWYGTTIKQWEKHWPFLSNNPDVPSTADGAAWEIYFLDHLGGFPATYRLFMQDKGRPYRDPKLKFLNMPERVPELFDSSYRPRG